MKALILLREKNCRWIREFFPESHPAMVRIGIKPLLEYLVDFVLLNGCPKLRIVIEEPDADLKNHFGNGARWGIDIDYGNASPDDTIDTLIKKNGSFCQDSSMLILDGFFFIHYDKNKDYHNWPKNISSGLVNSCRTGAVLFADNESCRTNVASALTGFDFALSPLETINDLFNITMQVVATEQEHYVMPGYGVEKGVLIGRNVEISKNVQIKLPVLIGDNVKLLGNAVIGPNVSISNNVIIDSGTQISQSIIFSDSYIGQGLLIDRKIVAGEQVISPAEGTSILIKDGFLFSPMNQSVRVSPGRYILEASGALLLATLQIIPYILLSNLLRFFNQHHVEKKYCYIRGGEKNKTFTLIKNNRTTLWGNIFSALSLDKFPLLGSVITGQLGLIGNRLLPVNEENRKFVRDFPDYNPGVFFYTESDAVQPGSHEEEVAQRFFIANRSFKQDTGVLVKTILSRFLGEKETDYQDGLSSI